MAVPSLALWVSLMVAVVQCSQDVIEVTVSGGNTVPLGHNTTYTCTLLQELDGMPVWILEQEGEVPLLITPQSSSVYAQNGRYVPRLEDRAKSTTLTITGTLNNNNTRIQCAQHLGGIRFGNTTEVFVFEVYGPPSPPTDLTVTQKSLETILLTWLAPDFTSPTPVNYRVEIVSEEADTIFLSADSTSLPMELQTLSCSPLNITVLAHNGAGRSNGTSISHTLLSANMSEDISQTVQHQVEQVDGVFVTEVSFQPPTFCPIMDEPPLYALALTISRGGEEYHQETDPVPLPVGSDSRLRLQHNYTSDWQNSAISYVIKASGFNITAVRTLYTTDVQRAILKVDHIQQAFEVTCEFLAHSSARGCLVTVNGAFGTYSRSVSREGGSARHQYHVGRPLGPLTYSVQDWEEDGSIGSALLPIELKNASLELPPIVVATAGITAESPSAVPEFLPPVAAVVGVVIVLLTVCIFATVLYYCLCAHKKGSVHASGGEEGEKNEKERYVFTLTDHNQPPNEEEKVYDNHTAEQVYDNLQHTPKANGHRPTSASPGPFSHTPPPLPASPPPNSPPPTASLPPSFPAPLPPSPPHTSAPSSSPPSSVPSPSSPTPLLQDTHYAEVQQPLYSRINEVGPLYQVLERPPSSSATSPATRSTPPLPTRPPSTPPAPPPPAGPSPSHTYSDVIKGNRRITLM